jgi:IMP dehydrogenase/GMP reductase
MEGLFNGTTGLGMSPLREMKIFLRETIARKIDTERITQLDNEGGPLETVMERNDPEEGTSKPLGHPDDLT